MSTQPRTLSNEIFVHLDALADWILRRASPGTVKHLNENVMASVGFGLDCPKISVLPPCYSSQLAVPSQKFETQFCSPLSIIRSKPCLALVQNLEAAVQSHSRFSCKPKHLVVPTIRQKFGFAKQKQAGGQVALVPAACWVEACRCPVQMFLCDALAMSRPMVGGTPTQILCTEKFKSCVYGSSRLQFRHESKHRTEKVLCNA